MQRYKTTQALLSHNIDHKNSFLKYIIDALIKEYDHQNKPSPPELAKIQTDSFRKDIFTSLWAKIVSDFRNHISHEKCDIYDACQETLRWLPMSGILGCE